MSELVIVRIADGEIVSPPYTVEKPARFKLPGGVTVCSPPEGWEGGGEVIRVSYDPVTQKESYAELAPTYRAVAIVQPADIPEGKIVTGSRLVATKDGVSREYQLIDLPALEPEPTRQEKLARLLGDYGLTIDDLKAELSEGVKRA